VAVIEIESMKSTITIVRMAGSCLALLILFQMGCHQRATPNTASQRHEDSPQPERVASAASVDPCALALTPHRGEERVDQEIIRLQEQARRAPDSTTLLEQLGWMFICKARTSFDPGFYVLAEQCALCLASKHPESLEAVLLRGHVLHNLHRFQQAERLAQELVQRRGLPADYGLLGDAQMEMGSLEAAIASYQTMLDLKPDLHSYARAAHVRWLKGDLSGALQAIQMAASAASPRDPESAAWVHSRLAWYHFQSGALSKAQQACAAALEFQNDYAPALLLRGRMLLSTGDNAEAIESLQRAARRNPLPEYQWVLAEALREADRDEEARLVEAQIKRSGPLSDPRTFALFLATRCEASEESVYLAQQELARRRDIFTLDALAWALASAGKPEEAQRTMELSMAEGTQDARLFFHAAVITARSGRKEEAAEWFAKATEQMHLLLPSEQALLAKTAIDLDTHAATETAFPAASSATTLSDPGN
jgi:tetratricopeptide (TPR) repeat protein